ncbi:MAG: hypothetical protein IT464_15945 [Planctomycetes bacterium]|nr:hypothetical protein [Planctomycetota bacterium]
MPVTNADLLSDDLLALWLVENAPIKIPFFQAWSWQQVAGKSLIYPRTTALAPAVMMTACGTVDEQLPDLSQAEMVFVDYATRYTICASDLDRYRNPLLLQAILFAVAKRRILYSYAAQLDSAGVLAAPGLPDLCAAGQLVDMGGLGLTLDCLDDAYERITAGTGRPTLIMSHSRSLRTYRKLCRDAGFKAERAAFKWYNPASRRMEDGSVDAFNGTPWLANDLCNADGTGTERTYFMVVGDDGKASPTRGVTGIVPAHLGSEMFIKRTVPALLPGPIQPDAGPGEDTFVTMPAGIAVGSQGALSIIQNYTTVASCGGGGG